MITNVVNSGKSSLTLTLLRLLDLKSGKIYIDGFDISTFPREVIRSKITTIPQDPFFLPTRSIRRTLAGSNISNLSDAQLIRALEKVELLGHSASQLLKPGEGEGEKLDFTAGNMASDQVATILDAKMSAFPLSAGQQQLFCLAKAMLQDNRIVILDEVTSDMDAATEERIRVVLKEELKGRTVLMVAHRPSMLSVCDVVVELEGGRVVRVTPEPG